MENNILRKGFTTGSCVTAAACASFKSLLLNFPLEFINIELVNLTKAYIKTQVSLNQNTACSIVQKDSGDDPDITNRIKIISKVTLVDKSGIHIQTGSGIGTITKKGLFGNIGDPAINPLPKKNIIDNLTDIADLYNFNLKENGILVNLSIPKGELLAKKTLNPKLGIEGGLSILGTTGLINPMSHESYLKTIELEIDQIYRNGFKSIVLVLGNNSYNYARSIGFKESLIVKIGNYIGSVLEYLKNFDFKKITIIGDLGKLVKVAGGIFNTHSSIADARFEILTAYLALAGAEKSILKEVFNCSTTREAISIINNSGYNIIYNQLLNKIKLKIQQKLEQTIKIEIILLSQNNLLAQESN